MAADARQKRLEGFVDLGMSRGGTTPEEPDAASTPESQNTDRGKPAQSGGTGNGAGENADPEDDPWDPLPPKPPPLPPELDWPDPIGREAYHGLLGEMVDATIPTTEADRNAILVQHLAMFGNAIGISDTTPYHVIGNNGIHRTNLFLLIVGESAFSRKGTSTSDVSVIYIKVDPKWLKDHFKRGLSSGEGLLDMVRDDRWGLDKDGNSVLEVAGSKTKNVLVYLSEFGGVLTTMQRQGNTLTQHMRDAWDGAKLETPTKSNPQTASNHLISIIGQTTLVELRAKLLTDDAQSGFGNRFLFLLARRERLVPRPNPLSAAVIADFATGLRAAIKTARTRGMVEMSEEAWALWGDDRGGLYRTLETPQPGLYGAVVSRAAPQVRRIALLYAMLDQRGIIEPQDLTAAHAVWQYSAASAFDLFGDRQIDPLTERVLDELRYAPAGLARTGLHAAFGNRVSTGALSKALATLLRDGLVRREIQSTGGRPAEIWHYVAGRRP
jgi:hypothetical protein